MENNLNYNNSNQLPPIVIFGNFEKQQELAERQNDIFEYYDYNTQKTIYPFFCGSAKKVTRCAINAGSIFKPKYKNVNDDSKEK